MTTPYALLAEKNTVSTQMKIVNPVKIPNARNALL